jgi:hypothetical protein
MYKDCIDWRRFYKDQNVPIRTKFPWVVAVIASCLIATGCALLGENTKPKGCRPVYSTSDYTSPPVSEAAIGDGTIYRLEKGIYELPIGPIVPIEAFKKNLAQAADRRNVKLFPLETLNEVEQEKLLPLVREISIKSGLTPILVTTSLLSIQSMLDDLMNRLGSTVSSQLFAMRGHVAATVADLNVIFKDRMQELYDNLHEAEQTALDRAQLMAAQATAALEKLQKEGFAAVSDALCQTTANFANYPNTVVGLGLPIERCFAPDILCLSNIDVRDTGTASSEQILQFRGVNLLPNGEYANATLLVSGQIKELPTGGGKSILQMPLPGGINGKPNDLTFRGPLFSRINFSWPKNDVERRWFFALKPYLVRSLEVKLVPTIEGPVRSPKDQACDVSAKGGSFNPREEFATCTIPADADKSIERCEEAAITSQNGDAQIRNRLFTVGACQWELRAKSEPRWGKGAWLSFIGRAHQIMKRRIPGAPYTSGSILNSTSSTAVFEYPTNLVPSEYKIISGRYSYTVRYVDNEGKERIFTEADPVDPKIGSAIMQGDRLTVTLR